MPPVEPLDVRIESVLKIFIQELAEKTGTTTSGIARDLAWVGAGVAKAGGIEVVGPFGLRRPLARLDLGESRDRLVIRLEDDLARELERVFRRNVRGALREAIRLGTFAVQPQDLRMRGPLGIERPFAELRLPEMRDEKVREALRRLQRAGR